MNTEKFKSAIEICCLLNFLLSFFMGVCFFVTSTFYYSFYIQIFNNVLISFSISLISMYLKMNFEQQKILRWRATNSLSKTRIEKIFNSALIKRRDEKIIIVVPVLSNWLNRLQYYQKIYGQLLHNVPTTPNIFIVVPLPILVIVPVDIVWLFFVSMKYKSRTG